jgi:hypothetical protein
MSIGGSKPGVGKGIHTSADFGGETLDFNGTLRPVASQQFQSLFCERFGCPPDKYEARMFRKCLFWHAKLLAPVLRMLSPNLFEEDFKFIRYLGASSDMQDARVDLLNFRDVNLGRPNFWRTDLKLRVSSRKARRLAGQLFAERREDRFRASHRTGTAGSETGRHDIKSTHE